MQGFIAERTSGAPEADRPTLRQTCRAMRLNRGVSQ